MKKIENILIESAQNRLDESWRMLRIAMEEVNAELLWKSPMQNGMALGNQLLHIRGNMHQYIISGFGQAEDQREREKEFSVKKGPEKEKLIDLLNETLIASKSVLKKSTLQQWNAALVVQGFNLSGSEAVMHAIEHFAYHVGQIAFWVKLNTQKDLGFYADHDLTVTSQNTHK